MMTLDDKDKVLLRLLQNDGRMSNAKMAEHLSISESSCWRRLKRLLDNGFIIGFQAVLDRKATGFDVLSFVQISCSQHSEEATAQFKRIIRASPNVLSCHNTTGDDDFLLQVVAKDLDDYNDFVEGVLRKIPGVVNLRSNISLQEVKLPHLLPL